LQKKDMRETGRRNRRRWRGRGFCGRGRRSCEDRRGNSRRGWWERGRWRACWWLSSWTEWKTMNRTYSQFLSSRGSCSALVAPADQTVMGMARESDATNSYAMLW